ncbi:M20 family metallopeptidase [Halorussus salinisoli]|uniref:M20 family metallopeptidase n=1 Tax=Halorussus salinisoli TaxID=2558242 RepID=UPI0010C182E6|nr:M20/M25/M40 family metallo-hydrolase [Halorussus salinisoli]
MVSSDKWAEITQSVEDNRGEAVDFLTKLVKTPSVNPPGEYDRIRSVLEEHYEVVGWEHRTVDAPRDLLESLGLPEPRPNVLATPDKHHGPTLGLIAHFDTVPANAEEWKCDPFGAEIVDGRLYGRGAKDCKARIAAYTLAVRALEALDLLPTKLNVVVAATADEETGSTAGAKYLAESGEFRPEYAILEGNVDRIWYATAGVLQYEVTISGKSAHAGLDPQKGANPIFGLEPLLPTVRSLNDKLSTVNVSIPGMTPPTCIPTMLDAGIKENVIPSTCKTTIDIRVPPNVESEWLDEKFLNTIEDLSLPDGLSISSKQTHRIDAYVADSEGILARTVRENAIRGLNGDVPMEGVMGPTDALWFGGYGCECVHFGPGDAESNQHGPDENVCLDQVIDAATVIAASILDLADQIDRD